MESYNPIIHEFQMSPSFFLIKIFNSEIQGKTLFLVGVMDGKPDGTYLNVC